MPNHLKARPADRDHLAALLADAHSNGESIGDLDVSALNRIIAWEPADMTVRVESGVSLAALQRTLADHRQGLPVDPIIPDDISIRDMIDNDLSGPHRYGSGTIRDYIIGITVATADGRLIRSGGNVVKNVAGFDLMRLFIGARGTLAVVVDVTFQLRPRPEAEIVMMRRVDTPTEADRLLTLLVEFGVYPTILDMHNIDTTGHAVVLGFSGQSEDVEYQRRQVADLGIADECDLSYIRRFVDLSNDMTALPDTSVTTLSVLPSQLCATVEGLDGAYYVARAGNGIVDFIGPASHGRRPHLSPLMKRMKSLFDPKNILPEWK